jgi:hypothetical protein
VTPCADYIDDLKTYVSNCAVMNDSLKEWNVPHEKWEEHLKQRINSGPVFRMCIEPRSNPPEQWVFGVLEPLGNSWVWKEKTAEELRELGIALFAPRQVSSAT